MRRGRTVESRRDRAELAHEAGFSKFSLGSVLAGVLVAYGAFAILAAITGAALNALGFDTTQLSSNDWGQYGIGSAIAVGVSLFLSYLWGGYVAGRMARRAGALNGFMVFFVGILVAVGVGAAVGMQADTAAIADNLRNIGVPTSSQEWMSTGAIAGIAALVIMLIGSMLGGISGERWHGKLVARALDPSIGPDHTVDLRDRRTDDTGARDGAHFQDGRDIHDPIDETGTVTRADTTLDEDLARTRTAH